MQCEIISILIKYLTRISLSQHERKKQKCCCWCWWKEMGIYHREREGASVMACKRLPLAASNCSKKGQFQMEVRRLLICARTSHTISLIPLTLALSLAIF